MVDGLFDEENLQTFDLSVVCLGSFFPLLTLKARLILSHCMNMDFINI